MYFVMRLVFVRFFLHEKWVWGECPPLETGRGTYRLSWKAYFAFLDSLKRG